MIYGDFVGEWVNVHTKASVNPIYAGKLAGAPTAGYLELHASYNLQEFLEFHREWYNSKSFFAKLFSSTNFEEVSEAKNLRKVAESKGQITRIPLDEIVAVTKI